MRKPNRKTVRDAIRASVPDGKLKRAKIVLADSPEKRSPIGGFTEYERANGGAVVKIGAPAGDNAHGITIRGHETRHATRHTPKRKKPMTENEAIAAQIVDDVNIECTPLPDTNVSLRPYRRAHLAVAMDGVRTLKKNARAVKNKIAPDTARLRNGNLLNAVRTVAMLHSYGQGGPEAVARERGYLKVRQAIGDSTYSAIAQVIKLAKNRRMRARAISVLVALMENEETPETERDEPETEDGDILAPVTGGDALDGHMRIVDLRPKTIPCDKEKSITRIHAPNGVIINPTRFLSAIISGDANGLFSRRVRQKPGGCVVIDASGSMGATRENLAALCALVPTATVAYYSGDDHGKGDLCVYANKGKRFNGTLTHVHGGNAVDLAAVKWLMRHGKPWTLVSDLEFCGGVLGSEIVAHALVERAVKRGDLTVYRSLDAAYEAFGGKGDLANAAHRKERAAAIAERSKVRRRRAAERAIS
jgi:hypothetical protein